MPKDKLGFDKVCTYHIGAKSLSVLSDRLTTSEHKQSFRLPITLTTWERYYENCNDFSISYNRHLILTSVKTKRLKTFMPFQH